MAQRIRTAVIGGGASGLMAACLLIEPGGSRADVALLERQPRVGRKLLATGNGRCNFTNVNVSPEKYITSTADVRELLSGAGADTVKALFARFGVPCFSDAEGRCYPKSNTASSVLDALRLYLDERGVTTLCGFDAVRLTGRDGSFTVTAADGREVRCDKVIYCPGGMASPRNGGTDSSGLLKALGHTFTPRWPGIAPIETDTRPIRGLKGVRAKAVVSLYDASELIRRESGEVLFTDSGISGICSMNLSLFVHDLKAPRLEIDFSQGTSMDELRAVASLAPKRDAGLLLSGIVPRTLSERIVESALGGKKMTCGEADPEAVYARLTAFPLEIKRVSGYDGAQVTVGGADMREFDPRTLESRRVKGLYVAGEICDVTGECGGYNLHWAWASALKAARAIRGEESL